MRWHRFCFGVDWRESSFVLVDRRQGERRGREGGRERIEDKQKSADLQGTRSEQHLYLGDRVEDRGGSGVGEEWERIEILRRRVVRKGTRRKNAAAGGVEGDQRVCHYGKSVYQPVFERRYWEDEEKTRRMRKLISDRLPYSISREDFGR